MYIVVNGEKHLMRHKSLKIQVTDDEPFEVRAEHNWDSSFLYTFEPKDNMVLQITRDRLFTQWGRLLLMAAATILASVILYFFEINSTSIIIWFSVGLCPVIYFFIRRKKFFAIQEVVEKK